MAPPHGFQFAIDRGGTFTDVYARCPNGKVRVMKLLSVDPKNYSDAPTEAIRRILQEETGNALDKDGKVNASLIEWIRMGTTVATNALLERKGEKMALVINKGFQDLLYIGNQARPHIFELDIKRPSVLYSSVVEIDCRVIPALEDKCQLQTDQWRASIGTTGEKMLVMKEIDEEEVRDKLAKLRESGIDSIAVVLAHSYTFHEHELVIGRIAKELGFKQISLSHEVTSMVRLVARGFTCSADAYLTPHIKEYVRSFCAGFSEDIARTNVLLMQSDGGLTPMDKFIGSRAILSGPAGGVVGYAVTSYQKDTDLPVIGFDMGGTSTDVSRYAGSLEHVHEATTAGVTIQAPQLDINTVAAGGGSMLFFRSGLFVVGPESAGAHPGPACYRKQGPLTVTDSNLVLGRLLPEYFPKIFGPNENEALDKEASLKKFRELTDEINQFMKETGGKPMTVEEVAMGFTNVANEAMCRPIRALTTARGHDASRHALATFGGAGGQHACAVAAALAVRSVRLHKYAGILSAYGMALADVVHEAQTPSAAKYTPEYYAELETQLDKLSEQCREKLRSQGFTDSQIVLEPYLHLRYSGTDCALMVAPLQAGQKETTCRYGDFYTAFIQRYKNEFGFTLTNRDVLVDDIRVRGIGKSEIAEETAPPSGKGTTPVAEKTVRVYFEGGYQDTQVYLLEKLSPDQEILGPAIIMDNLSTILVEPNCRAAITKHGDINITIGSGQAKKITTDLEPIQLSIFSHRFMSIAEQMGRILQRTSISVNIKERLDFSCALFGADGGLVSNAPHIPVHLGSMQDTVQHQMRVRGGTMKRGEVYLANHPKAGGSHLPDLTVITPVFHKSEPLPIFFVASRGHHADIGGLTPGSMPPHSTSLSEEGAAFKSFLLLDEQGFREKELVEELMKPAQEPGCSGTRNLADNLSDLKAQVAANQKGIQLVGELIEQYGLDVVQAYMSHIQKNAEVAIRDMLKQIAKKAIETTGSPVLKATEYMDNGTPITLTVTLDQEKGGAICDFTGTGAEVWGNLNAPRAITLSALIYCLRCMVGHDVPLNQGCLTPLQVIVPPGSILDPSETAAVVGGNVLTSQRVVDVVLKAFQVCAASTGCMNNLTLGEEDWGYYETVAGGSGAGPGWHGASGVHTHMTNTRITDVEIAERRYPLIVRAFSLRIGSGGRGRWNGGDGVTRELIFRRSMQVSVLTERRAFQPYGMNGGEAGARGLNLLQRADGRIINLGGKTSVKAFAGDKYIMNSPAGGGYGVPTDEDINKEDKVYSEFLQRGSVYEYKSAQESV